MQTIISIKNLSKVYDSGFNALKSINLDINKGEILGLLGPNGAGKTTLISTICGIVSPTSGSVTVDGFDIIKDFRKTRSIIQIPIHSAADQAPAPTTLPATTPCLRPGRTTAQ